MSEQTNQQPFDVWAVVELMGHRRVIGRVSEQEIAGAGFLRIDLPTDPPQTQYYAPGSVYAITPVSEEAARLAARRAADPISVWELPEQIRAAISQDDPAELWDDHEAAF